MSLDPVALQRRILLQPSTGSFVIQSRRHSMNLYRLRQSRVSHLLQLYWVQWSIKLKKVQVQMSDQCHAVLKDYANAWDMTMSEVMYEAIRSFIHKDSEYFEHISSLLAFRGISIDKRTSKQCYGHLCFACKHRTACGTGLYEGSWETNAEAKQYTALHSP